ncbi:oligosaccharyl transferase delta subunit [Marasmius fiardii PR-910]|nr:oligosaccharyl transferase delta subunit [Marasmius fiardii PR-910]
MHFASLPVLLLAVSSVQASKTLTLQSPRVVISASDGSQLRSEPLSVSQKLSSSLSLEQTDVLKLSFQVVDKESGNGVQPQQTFLRFYDANTTEEGIQPLRISTSGKVKFELNMAKPPSSLPPTFATPLQVTLLLGNSQYKPLKINLFDLHVPPSYPVAEHPDEALYRKRPDIQHTFRPEPKTPPKVMSAVFAGLVGGLPWVLLIGLWSQLTNFRLTHLLSPHVIPFTLTLGAFEVLLFQYWVGLKLGEVLLYGAVLGVVTLFTGKHALSNIAERRTSGK